MISMDKKYKTRDGREVRIYAVDGQGPYPVHGAIWMKNFWSPCNWTELGTMHSDGREADSDLIEVKPRIQREYWVNVYKNIAGVPFDTKEAADKQICNMDRIACVKITIDCEEGEGL